MQKILVYILAAVLCVAVGFLASGTYHERKYANLDNEYKDTISKLRNTVDILQTENSIAQDRNRDLTERLAERQKRLDDAARIIEEMGTGLSGAFESVRYIEYYVHEIEQAIKIIFDTGETIPR